MKISVIIPTYNRLPYLKRAIASVRAQTYCHHELIVVDDHSTDETKQWLEGQSGIKRLLSPQTQGAAAARNLALEVAEGNAIAFLDSDDAWLPTYLERQVAALQSAPDAVLSYAQIYSIAPGITRRVARQPCAQDFVQAMLLGNFIDSLSQVMVPRWALERVGRFNPALSVCHDRDFYLRLFAIGAPVQVPSPLVQKYWLSDGLVFSDGCENWLSDGLKLLDIFFAKPENARYKSLRETAEQSFFARVKRSQTAISNNFV